MRQGHHKAVEVGARDVLEVHARAHADRQRVLDDAQELVHRLARGSCCSFLKM